MGLLSQEIYIQRSDVDTSRNSFITASYTFTINIFVKDIKNTNGVAFQLNYNLANYVRFSQWKIGDYGTPQVVAFEDTAGFGRLIVAVNKGESTISDSITDPLVITLEFVTLQNAPNNYINTFEFINPVATIIDTLGRSIIALSSELIAYNLHGYVDVWPGDTDNNGLVDHLDFAPVSQYVGFGSATKKMKSFKRKSGSAIWGPHSVLTWDSAAVTYADCDGNGDITISDMLIVTYNIGKDTNNYQVKKNKAEILSKFPSPTLFSNESTRKIPIIVNTNNGIMAATGEINIGNLNQDEIIGVEPGSAFADYPFNYSVKRDGKLYFAVGSYSKTLSDNNEIANLVVSNSFNCDIDLYLQSMKGIDKYGSIIPLSVISGVAYEDGKEEINGTHLVLDEYVDKIIVCNLIGQIISEFKNTKYLELSNLERGFYYINIFDKGNIRSLKYLGR